MFSARENWFIARCENKIFFQLTLHLFIDFLQVNLKAYLISYPEQAIFTTVTVTVNRNVYGPAFQPSSNYEAPLVASFNVGDEVLTVEAIDRDELVCNVKSWNSCNFSLLLHSLHLFPF